MKPRHFPLRVGEPAPWFTARSPSNPRYTFHGVAGRYVVLYFFGSAADADSQAMLAQFKAHRELFDDGKIAFFGVSNDEEDEKQARVANDLPGMRIFWDANRAITQQFGLVDEQGALRKFVYVLDIRLRILAGFSVTPDVADCAARLFPVLEKLPPLGEARRAAPQAPVLVVPRVFDPVLCKTLIETYDQAGGRDSGFMRDVDGKTRLIVDHGHKRRRDHWLEDDKLRRACIAAMRQRLLPQITNAFQFQATLAERHIVSCYDADEAGHFRPHRDNTTLATAHRKFAVSLFLNAGEFDGGFLRFPEYGPALYTAPTGGAVVFSCSMLHEATVVTKGKRYMYLPFLYDANGAEIRARNQQFLETVDGTDSGAATNDAP